MSIPFTFPALRSLWSLCEQRHRMLEEFAVLTLCSRRVFTLSYNAVRVVLPSGLQALVVTPVFAETFQLHPPLWVRNWKTLYSPAYLSLLTFRNTTLTPFSWKGIRKGDCTLVTFLSLISSSFPDVFYLRLISA